MLNTSLRSADRWVLVCRRMEKFPEESSLIRAKFQIVKEWIEMKPYEGNEVDYDRI
ncbi:hypothetical protein RirG_205200 [Rhizophagus irregularis DAOM 197198w]|uniref:Uncharacterized protein n=1 Tax=Rhizophagus irregularis (strain DAOM 197198w) TaxID=1432141 RepID=A0A015LSM0_RHIIW|nr:hypothetical protein RirG_205200 [Rhizophagus irregularis DAOM 197198w]